MLGAEALFAKLSEIFRVGQILTAMFVDFFAQRFGIKITLAQQRENRGLFMQIEHGSGAVLAGHAELFARVDGAGAFEDVDAEQEIGFAVGNRAGGRI